MKYFTTDHLLRAKLLDFVIWPGRQSISNYQSQYIVHTNVIMPSTTLCPYYNTVFNTMPVL